MTIMRNAQVDHHAHTDDHRPRSRDRAVPELTTARITRRNRSEAARVPAPRRVQEQPSGVTTSVATAPSLGRAPHPWTDRHDQLIATARERLDVRLHEPIPHVMIVRIAGPIDGPTVALLTERVGHQLDRATHVILDLDQVQVLSNRGVSLLLDLHLKANARGCRLSIAVGDHEVVRRPLRLTGLDQVLTLSPCADAAIAALSCRCHAHHVAEDTPSTRRAADKVAQISGAAVGPPEAQRRSSATNPARRGER